MRDLVVARNCCMARMLPGEAEVSELSGLPGRAKSVKLFERSNGLDTALYKNYFLQFEQGFCSKGPFKCYVTLFFWKLDPHPPPRNANNTEHYTFVTLFSRKSDTLPPPSALRNT